MERKEGRKFNQLRKILIEGQISSYAEGSALISYGNTKVLCTATVESKVPSFLKGTGSGWVTAEYGMLPRATLTRMDRESVRGKQSGRTQEIQRLIGRSLRSVVDLNLLGERQIKIDCDVIQADGGTRTAAISGAYVALYLACKYLLNEKLISAMPIKEAIGAVSCGLIDNAPLLDLDYDEDSQAQVDSNFVITDSGKIVEIQLSSEKEAISKERANELLELAELGIRDIILAQTKALES